jgi:hypothetical protein
VNPFDSNGTGTALASVTAFHDRAIKCARNPPDLIFRSRITSPPSRTRGIGLARRRHVGPFVAGSVPIAGLHPAAGASARRCLNEISPMKSITTIQEAMAFAMAHPVRSPPRTVYGEVVRRDKFSPNLVQKCRIVLRHSRELAERVLDGSIELHKAFREVRPLQPKPTKPRRPPPRPEWQRPDKPKQSLPKRPPERRPKPPTAPKKERLKPSDFLASVTTEARYWSHDDAVLGGRRLGLIQLKPKERREDDRVPRQRPPVPSPPALLYGHDSPENWTYGTAHRVPHDRPRHRRSSCRQRGHPKASG